MKLEPKNVLYINDGSTSLVDSKPTIEHLIKEVTLALPHLNLKFAERNTNKKYSFSNFRQEFSSYFPERQFVDVNESIPREINNDTMMLARYMYGVGEGGYISLSPIKNPIETIELIEKVDGLNTLLHLQILRDGYVIKAPKEKAEFHLTSPENKPKPRYFSSINCRTGLSRRISAKECGFDTKGPSLHYHPEFYVYLQPVESAQDIEDEERVDDD